MRTDQTTITLSRDVEPGGDVAATETALLEEAGFMLQDMNSAWEVKVLEAPAPYKTGTGGEYRKMRDGEHQEQHTEVRVRMVIA
jgi:hypothetical protein